jgi:quercetin dioxygenase-like cupin family protein
MPDVVRVDAAQAGEPPDPENFIGRVRMQNLAAVTRATGLDYLAVHFDAGAHTRPHAHSTDQVLFFVQGSGFLWIAGEERQHIDEGGIVSIAAGVVHMHGATEDEPICHIAVRAPGPTDWSPQVSDDWRRFSIDG